MAGSLVGTLFDGGMAFLQSEELTHQIGAGAHELSAALFNGSAFVMYQRRDQEGPSQEQGFWQSSGIEPLSPSPEIEPPKIEQDNSGMTM